MPELPDLTVYLEHLQRRIQGQTLQAIRLQSPFLLRTVTPTIEEVCQHKVVDCSRLARKRVRISRRKSRRFILRWRHMASTNNLVRCVALLSSG